MVGIHTRSRRARAIPSRGMGIGEQEVQWPSPLQHASFSTCDELTEFLPCEAIRKTRRSCSPGYHPRSRAGTASGGPRSARAGSCASVDAVVTAIQPTRLSSSGSRSQVPVCQNASGSTMLAAPTASTGTARVELRARVLAPTGRVLAGELTIAIRPAPPRRPRARGSSRRPRGRERACPRGGTAYRRHRLRARPTEPGGASTASLR